MSSRTLTANMPKYISKYISINNHEIPVRVYLEWRNSIRYSVGKSYLLLRVPKIEGTLALEKHLRGLRDWVIKRSAKNPDSFNCLIPRKYSDGDVLRILDQEYVIEVIKEDRANFSGRLNNNIIQIKAPVKAGLADLNKATRDVIIKLLNRAYQPFVKGKVLEINERYFKEKIDRVSLKYNTSNWGSCSSKRNINLSSRLLLTNHKVLHYVIVHELSHLIEMNHSKRFWKIVKDVMPDYEECEKWLTKNGKYCYL